MKRLLILGLALGIAACSPDIPAGTTNPAQFVEAEFDPANSVIPLPNDLLFLQPDGSVGTTLNAPTTGGTAAQNEFNANYLNTLDGFPMESTASVLFSGPIDLSSVKLFGTPGANLLVFDITNQNNPQPVGNLSVTNSNVANGAQSLNIIPTSGYWTRGHRYGVLVVGGTNGIKGGTTGQIVTGSPTWSLVSGSAPVLACDADGGNCRPGSSVIPAPGTTPSQQYDAQLRNAQQLNLLQQNYAPFIAGATAAIPGLTASDIAIGWTFTITSQAEVTFDPAHSIIPFPNDILNPTGSQVALPVPPDAGAITALYTGLNTLDGFSTSAPLVSENGLGTGPLIQGTVKASTVSLGVTGTMNLVQGAPGTGAAPTTDGGVIRAHACLNCPGITMVLPDGGPVLLADGGVKPDTLAIVPDIPLTERTLYAAYITTDLQDTTNKNVIASPAFALIRSSAPLSEGGHSTVSLLTDEQAAALEPLRSALEPLFTGLAAQGLPRSKLALGWAFTTETTVGALSQLHAIPSSPQAAQVPAVPLWMQEIPPPAGVPTTGVGHWYIGEIVDIFLLTSSTGTLNPSAPATSKMPFVMSVPATGAPASGYAVSLFGHGFTRTRDDGFGMSAGLAAANNVMVAIDEPWHGERNTCVGFGAFLAQAGVPAAGAVDSAACIPPTGQTIAVTCNQQTGRCQSVGGASVGTSRPGAACTHTNANADQACILAGQGHCAPDNQCENATFAPCFPYPACTTASPPPGSFAVSGWKFINLNNFFASRDNIRQQVVSNAQLTRVLANTAVGNIGQQAGGITLNPAAINYTGQSLGGILGMNTSAISPEIKNAALNVPGGHLTQLILTSPSFTQLAAGLQAGLAAEGIPTYSPEYDQFIATIQWILDPGDPINSAPYLVRNTGLALSPGGSTRRGYVQWIAQDQTVPNPTTAALIQSVVGDPTANGVLMHPTDVPGIANFWANQYPSSANVANNHGFLLGTAGAATAQQAQGQIATFVAGGAPFP